MHEPVIISQVAAQSPYSMWLILIDRVQPSFIAGVVHTRGISQGGRAAAAVVEIIMAICMRYLTGRAYAGRVAEVIMAARASEVLVSPAWYACLGAHW